MRKAPPKLIVVDVGDCMKDLQRVTDVPELPTIDNEVLLEGIVDTLLHDQTAEYELKEFLDPRSQRFRDAINENLSNLYPDDMDLMDECVFSLDTVSLCAVRIGHHLRKTFSAFKLHEGGYLNYEYGGKINGRTMVLRRRGSGNVP